MLIILEGTCLAVRFERMVDFIFCSTSGGTTKFFSCNFIENVSEYDVEARVHLISANTAARSERETAVLRNGHDSTVDAITSGFANKEQRISYSRAVY